MQDLKKSVEINRLLCDIFRKNLDLSKPVIGAYYDYDTVIETLMKVKEVMEISSRCPRPAGLSTNLIWSERFYDSENEPDPFVYDGSMPPEDFEKWQNKVLEDISLERG